VLVLVTTSTDLQAGDSPTGGFQDKTVIRADIGRQLPSDTHRPSEGYYLAKKWPKMIVKATWMRFNPNRTLRLL
jgi:hypothetical protein